MKRLNKLKTLAVKAFESFEGALRQLSSREAKQLGNLRKGKSKLVRMNSVMLSECETFQNSCNSKIMRFFGLRPQNAKSNNVTYLLTYSPINLFTKRRVAFTLAEVLITLGVIGVVAAMTIPTLIKNHEKHVIETQLKKTYSDIGNWIKRSEVDNESAEYWDYTLEPSEFVDRYFSKYVKLKSCTWDLVKTGVCFQNEGPLASWGGSWRYPSGAIYPNNTEHVYSERYLLPDGRAIAIRVDYSAKENWKEEDWSYIYFIVDVNGARGKSILGKDVFWITYFNYNHWDARNKGKLLFGDMWNGRGHNGRPTSDIINDCKSDGDSCGILLQRNGWKFPKDYPIKF